MVFQFIKTHSEGRIAARLLGFAGLLLLLLALGAGFAAQALAESPLVTAVAASGTQQKTRVITELRGDTAFSLKAMAEPYRLVIDIPQARFDLPSGVGRKKRGMVEQIRYGKSPQGESQVVINTTGPFLIEKSFAEGRNSKRAARIVVELTATSPERFARSIAGESDGEARASSPEFTASLPLFWPRAPAYVNHRRVIVIDPGHGGIDPGAVSALKTKEKDVALAFGKSLRQALAASGQFDVKLTRENDSFISLRDRLAFAHKARADLFIAIHADTVRGQTVTGTTLYTLSERASDAEAEALAQKENRADVIAGIDLGEQNPQVAGILVDLVRRESKNHAVLFSRKALEQLKGITTMTGKPLRSAGFMVLRAADIPSVLIELGYLSNPEDERNLLSAAWRMRMSEALARAVIRHFADPSIAAAAP